MAAIVTVIALLILVQLMKMLGDWLAVRSDKKDILAVDGWFLGEKESPGGCLLGDGLVGFLFVEGLLSARSGQ